MSTFVFNIDGSSLSVDKQLCRLAELQVLPAIRLLDLVFIAALMLAHGPVILLFVDVEGVQTAHAQQELLFSVPTVYFSLR